MPFSISNEKMVAVACQYSWCGIQIGVFAIARALRTASISDTCAKIVVDTNNSAIAISFFILSPVNMLYLRR